MKTIDTVFLAESVTTRSNTLVMITNPKNEADRKKQSPFAKVGRVPGQSIKGWLRHAMSKLLIDQGVSVCHPLSEVSVTAERNKEYFEQDLAIGYHSRGSCQANGGCLIYQLFGDLNKPANLMTKSVYFYPSTSGNGTATTNLNKAFGTVGSGRIEIINSSPRCQKETHLVFLTVEHVSGVAIEAPLKLILRQSNPDYEIVVLKTLDYLNTMVQNEEFDFLLGGMRSSGYGRAKVLPLIPKKAKTNKTKTGETEISELETDGNGSEAEESAKGYKIQFKYKKEEAANLDEKFQKIAIREREKFPIKSETIKENTLKPEKLDNTEVQLKLD